MSRLINRRLPDGLEKYVIMLGSITCWTLFVMLRRIASNGLFTFASILIGPCLLLLTYCAVGGDIPLKWRQKGYHRIMIFGPVFWISFVAAIIFERFHPHCFE